MPNATVANQFFFKVYFLLENIHPANYYDWTQFCILSLSLFFLFSFIYSPLPLTIILAENVEIVRLLLENGHPANCYDWYETSPVSAAISLRDKEIMKLLLEHGAKVNRNDVNLPSSPATLPLSLP